MLDLLLKKFKNILLLIIILIAKSDISKMVAPAVRSK